MKRKEILKSLLLCLFGIVVVSAAGLIITGWKIGWGPFASLKSYENEVQRIEERYICNEYQNDIIFYGASNFRLWTEMESDIADYTVQNHGFGGSTDKLLVEYAPRLLYPYHPNIVFFQTGSNDYVNLSGTDEERIRICMEFKQEMFEAFHEQLPDTTFVVMSGLLLPGRSQYTALTQQINEELRQFCDERDYMVFVDASQMTFDGLQYDSSLFENDGIHLSRAGRTRWCEEYIRPQIVLLCG